MTKKPTGPEKCRTIARKFADYWVSDDAKDLRSRIGEQEFAYRMYVAVAKKARDVGRREK